MHWLGTMMTIELKRLRSGGTVWAMVEYSHRFPLVISTVEGSRTRLVDGIQNDTIDIAVEAASDCNRSMVLWSKRIIVALPENVEMVTRNKLQTPTKMLKSRNNIVNSPY